eukprot:TRINITY_DN1817_c0_g1::TRINITY_DN1817_c0_g1_i1::g.14093::m.14093 TRINITY_DN1817_c0_g1::TRINITY_DN1817_c0_g1_i1::g.14093  ORF type:complete len:385 (+),score=124.98,sp/Q9SF40/RL4A_ARATH/56.81/6e-151,Ribosomal_L4/PF00573.17/1.1e-42,Ribosomal_L4/PF00573.17/1.2e+03,Ribos_L4_asso_C/PF14374.1/4.6e+03,Ribos_L4_asso_C/PF14374.1/3.4e-26 TRINITY_DN1817_c0_g1_i1:45-1157(+)
MATACARPLVSVFSTSAEKAGQVTLPAVFVSPIRTDVVHHVHRDMAKNKRQAYAVSVEAGHQTSAESWGTGRAVSRIPRVPGGGTHRAGQGAFGNMCRGGRMFAPNKTWRRWHRKISVGQRRYALTSALAASAIPALVMARGHKIEEVPEIPLVVQDTVQSAQKTAQAAGILAKLGAEAELAHSKESRKIRRGVGKMRNRRYVLRRGPLVVYDKDEGLTKAFRNLPGVELASVDRLNLLSLAPGGHLGRFVLWTQSAFEKLDKLYGTYRKASSLKKDYNLPQHMMTNTDLARIINSDEIQSVVRPAVKQARVSLQRKNALTNLGVRARLNPLTLSQRRSQINSQAARQQKKEKVLSQKRAGKEFLAQLEA